MSMMNGLFERFYYVPVSPDVIGTLCCSCGIHLICLFLSALVLILIPSCVDIRPASIVVSDSRLVYRHYHIVSQVHLGYALGCLGEIRESIGKEDSISCAISYA